jgi:hypothetical protein
LRHDQYLRLEESSKNYHTEIKITGNQEIYPQRSFFLSVLPRSPSLKPMPVTTAKPEPENLLLNLICNVGLPTAIMSWCSGDQLLGPKAGLLVALIFPLAYGVHDFLRRRRMNFISIIGFSSVLISGGFGLMNLDGFWFAVKDGALPALIGLAADFVARRVLLGEPQQSGRGGGREVHGEGGRQEGAAVRHQSARHAQEH